jgi:ribonuclease HI
MTHEWEVWCDGSYCSQSKGPCGWGAVIKSQDGKMMCHCGFIMEKVNSGIAEMTAAIESLRLTPGGTRVILHSDNKPIMDRLNNWLSTIKTGGAKKPAGKKSKNRHLWEILCKECQTREVEPKWVRGHSGDKGNEMADKLAKIGRDLAQIYGIQMPAAHFVLNILDDRATIDLV